MFERSKHGAVSVIEGASPLNTDTATQWTATVNECLGEGQPRIVLDMQEIPLVDSFGLEALLDVRDRLEREAGAIKLAGPNPLCRDILEVTGVGNSFEIFGDVKAAVGSFLL